MNTQVITRLRQIAAALTGLGAAWAFMSQLHTTEKTVLIPPAALCVAALMAQLPWLGAQLLARGLWWANMLLGVLLCVLGSRSEHHPGVWMTVLCGLALLVADRKALARAAQSSGFRPTAYLGTLQLMMVLALADAQTLFLFAALEFSDRHGAKTSLPLGIVGGCLIVGFVGLYRVALWGVLATMSSALVLALLVLFGRLEQLGHELRNPLLVGCAIQLLVPMPMLLSMALKRPLPSLPSRSRNLAASITIVLVVVSAVAYALR